MWKKIKENWKTYLLLILSALFGTDQALEYAAQPEAPPGHLPRVEEPAPEPDNAWIVTGWVQLETTTKAKPGLPTLEYVDRLGRETAVVESREKPTVKAFIFALGLDPNYYTATGLEYTPPGGREEPAPGEPDEK